MQATVTPWRNGTAKPDGARKPIHAAMVRNRQHADRLTDMTDLPVAKPDDTPTAPNMCACTDCICQQPSLNADGPNLGSMGELCGCCAADCRDVHPWNNIGDIYHCEQDDATTITEANAFTLGPVKRGPHIIGHRFGIQPNELEKKLQDSIHRRHPDRGENAA